jgi:hypothetical protein
MPPGALNAARKMAAAASTTPQEIIAAGSFSALRHASEIRAKILTMTAMSSISIVAVAGLRDRRCSMSRREMEVSG